MPLIVRGYLYAALCERLLFCHTKGEILQVRVIIEECLLG